VIVSEFILQVFHARHPGCSPVAQRWQHRAVADVADVRLRPARRDEADVLSRLALRSKGHWGYDRAFLDACREELTFRPDEIGPRRMVVAESARRVLGFYSLDGEPPDGELGNMWIEPASIGTGLGRLMWQHATQAAGRAGFAVLDITAEPFAEGFYLAMGAERVGQTPSGSIPGRTLPVLRIQVASARPRVS
jgi:GNAT superfamily N-acetyltransferase